MDANAQSKQVKKASEYVGGQHLLAKLIGVSPPEVCQWIKNIRPVPIKKCVALEMVTNKAVTRKELRPDDWHLIWPELADPTPKEKAC